MKKASLVILKMPFFCHILREDFWSIIWIPIHRLMRIVLDERNSVTLNYERFKFFLLYIFLLKFETNNLCLFSYNSIFGRFDAEILALIHTTPIVTNTVNLSCFDH